MRIQVNLASKPFVELRPFFARLRLIMGVLLLLAAGLMVWSHALQTKLNAAQAQMDALRRQTDGIQEETLHNQQRMRQPTNAAVLDRAHFLNTLFLRKSFSWTAVMMDLENVLPLGVQVTSIEPQITADGDVVIRLRVSGERDRAVQLVRNLERSRRFRSPRLTGESVQAKESGQGNGVTRASVPAGPAGVEFEILADYVPLPAGQPYAPVRTKTHVEGSGPSGSAGFRRPVAVRPQPIVRGPYPADGVVLKPYKESHPEPPTAIRPAPAPVAAPGGKS